MWNQQQGGLPYRTDAPQTPPLPGIGPNNPPYVPQIQHLPEIMQWLPVIAGFTASEIQEKAPINSLRTFMYNMYSENNFANEAFNSLVAGICDYVAVYANKRAYGSLEEAIAKGVPLLVNAMAAVNVRNYPALAQLVPGEIQQDVRQAIVFFDNLVAEINAVKSGQNTGMSVSQPSLGWGGSPGMQQQTWQNFPQAGQGGNWGGGQGGQRVTGGGGWSNQFGGGGGFGNVPARSAIFNAPSTNQRAPGAVGRTSLGDKYGSNTQQREQTTEINFAGTPPPPPPPPTTAAQVLRQPHQAAAAAVTAAPPPEPQEVPAHENWGLWRPSAQQPYLPAYNPEDYELYFQKNANGVITYNLKQRNNLVDQSRHSTASTFGAKPASTNTAPPQEVLPQLAAGVKKLRDEQDGKATAEGEEDGQVVMKFKGTIRTLSQKAVIFQGKAEAHVLNNGEVPVIFRTYALVAEPVLTAKDENPRLMEYQQARDFKAAKRLLDFDAGAMTPWLWATCNRRLTEGVNRFLRCNLAITTQIDSFVMDIEELPDFLTQKYGDAITNALMRNQQEIIRTQFEFQPDEQQREWNEEFLSGDVFTDENRPHVVYPSHFVSLTYVNCRPEELGVVLAPKISSLVDSKITPEIYDVMQSLFDDIRNEREEAFARHLIVLEDGTLLEASEGALMPGSYLLGLAS